MLSASALGAPVYLKLGFEGVFRYEFFRWGGMGYERWAGEDCNIRYETRY